MRSHQGFTLIEAVLALGIAALLVGLTTGWARALSFPLQTDATEFYEMLAVLEVPQRYSVDKVSATELTLKDWTEKQKIVTLSVDHDGMLKLSSQTGQGYLPLLAHVTKLNWQKTTSPDLVRLNLKQEGLPWRHTIVDFRGGS
ncbi:prepilin-type N-terminal cleavage/methylation domain-containing protein [Levilactobacillus suantsaii]|uniref:Competence protein ComGF n=1 Tax=Levilactobacillus suantsaii TaxID=2292255 RepID=A0A4Q0VJJ9_9LACO|nr:prepilin-type N-terminal cleavage/methylation domain-containing protein [Levilactobacillus suantsaii]QMU07871.1 prepilin-type N-terminal cleavage/methylation domain-containing protein [Levilactobacillus suantsaii]RXI79752.1 competence protein ComGF [Levilactobacillus suantsaii]